MLDGPRFGPMTGGAPRRLVVVLHGFGADGADLLPLAEALAPALPDALFVVPDAPEPCEDAPSGRQWFRLGDLDPRLLANGVRAAAGPLRAAIAAELARLGLGPDALGLVGFSQGAMVALAVGLRGAPAPAAIIGFSGALLDAGTLAVELAQRPRVLLVHGAVDTVVPASRSTQAAAALVALGVPVETLIRPGLGHAIDAEGIAAAAALLGGSVRSGGV